MSLRRSLYGDLTAPRQQPATAPAASVYDPQAELSETEKALVRGFENTRASGYAMRGLARGVLGNDEGALEDARRAQEIQEAAPRNEVQELDDIENVGDALAYARNLGVEQLPNIATTLVSAVGTGGLGLLARGGLGAAAKAVGLRRAQAAVAGRAASGQAAAAAEKATEAAARGRAFQAGQAAGAVGAGVTMQAGQIAPEALLSEEAEGSVRERSLKALAGSVGTGAIDALPAIRLLGRYGLRGKAAEAVSAGVLQEMGTQALTEGSTEVAQTVGEKLTHQWVGINKELIGPEAFGDYLNAFVGGAVGGAIFGAPAALRGRSEDGKPGAREQVASKLKETMSWFRGGREGRPKPGEPMGPGGPEQGVVRPNTVADEFEDARDELRADELLSDDLAARATGKYGTIVDPQEMTSLQQQYGFLRDSQGQTLALAMLPPDARGYYLQDNARGMQGETQRIDFGMVQFNNEPPRADKRDITFQGSKLQNLGRAIEAIVFGNVKDLPKRDSEVVREWFNLLPADKQNKFAVAATRARLAAEANESKPATPMMTMGEQAALAARTPDQIDAENDVEGAGIEGDFDSANQGLSVNTFEGAQLEESQDNLRSLRGIYGDGNKLYKGNVLYYDEPDKVRAILKQRPYAVEVMKDGFRKGVVTDLPQLIARNMISPEIAALPYEQRPVAALYKFLTDVYESGMEVPFQGNLLGQALVRDPKTREGTIFVTPQMLARFEPTGRERVYYDKRFGDRWDFSGKKPVRITDPQRLEAMRQRDANGNFITSSLQSEVTRDFQTIDPDFNLSARRVDEVGNSLEQTTGLNDQEQEINVDNRQVDALKLGPRAPTSSSPEAGRLPNAGPFTLAGGRRVYSPYQKYARDKDGNYARDEKGNRVLVDINAPAAVKPLRDVPALGDTPVESTNSAEAGRNERRLKVITEGFAKRLSGFTVTVTREKMALNKKTGKREKTGEVVSQDVSPFSELSDGEQTSVIYDAAVDALSLKNRPKWVDEVIREATIYFDYRPNAYKPTSSDKVGYDGMAERAQQLWEQNNERRQESRERRKAQREEAEKRPPSGRMSGKARDKLLKTDPSLIEQRRANEREKDAIKKVLEPLPVVATSEARVAGLRAIRDLRGKGKYRELKRDTLVGTDFKADEVTDAELKDIASGKPSLETEQSFVDRITDMLGLPRVKMQHAKSIDLGNGRKAAGGYDPKRGVIIISDTAKGERRVETILHEIGHHLWANKWKTADEATKRAIVADYKAWRRANVKRDAHISDVRASRAPLFIAMEQNDHTLFGMSDRKDYLVDFEEYFADQVARALITKPAVKNKVQAFFADIAKAMRKAYKSIFKSPMAKQVLAAKSVDQLVIGMMRNARTGPPVPPQGGNPARGGGGASLPTDYWGMLSTEERGALLSVFTDEDIQATIVAKSGITPEALRNYDTRSPLLVNAGVALWLKGELNITDGLPMMRQLAYYVRKALGLPSDQQLAERILSDINGGRVQQLRKVYSARKAVADAGNRLDRMMYGARQAYEKAIKPVSDRLFADLDARLRAMNNEAVNELVTLVRSRTGEFSTNVTRGMLQSINEQRSKFITRLLKITDPLSNDEKDQLRTFLQEQGDINTLPDKLKTAAEQYYAMMREFLGYSATIKGDIPNFFPVRMDTDEVSGRRDEFIDMLLPYESSMRAVVTQMAAEQSNAGKKAKLEAMANKSTAKELAEYFYKMATYENLDSPGSYFPTKDKQGDYSNSKTPAFASANKRIMQFMYRKQPGMTDEQFAAAKKKFASFQRKDMENIVVGYVDRGVKRTEYTRVFGEKGVYLAELINRAVTDGATEQDLGVIKTYIDSVMGVHNDRMNPFVHNMLKQADLFFGTKMADVEWRKVKSVQTAILTYQNLRLLPLAALSSFIDPIGVYVRGGSAGDALRSFKQGIKAMAGDRTHLLEMAEALGVVEQYALHETLAALYGAGDYDGSVGQTAQKLNNLLFKYNGLESITKFTRLMALANAHRFLLKHADLPDQDNSLRYLRELNLKPGDIEADPDNPGFVKIKNARVREALVRFVNESVVRPTATQKPGWYNDPNFVLVTQYKGFMYGMYNTILRRMLDESFKHGNWQALAPVLAYLPMTLAASILREMAQFGPEGDPEREEWGTYEYLVHAVDRSGLLPPRFTQVGDAAQDVSFGSSVLNSFAGPTAQQLGALYDTVTGDRTVARFALDSMPLNALIEDWPVFVPDPAPKEN